MTLYLYIKTHNQTGLKYLGQTSKNPFKYKGSGKYWKRHLKQHGNDVITDILGTYQNKEDLSAAGIYYSKLWNIVESSEWANLGPETGDAWNRGIPNPIHSERMKINNPNKNGIYGGAKKGHIPWNIGKSGYTKSTTEFYTFHCEECGNPITQRVSKKRERSRFCGKSCAASWINKNKRIYKSHPPPALSPVQAKF